MSAEGEREMPLGNSGDIEARAAAWLERRHFEAWSETDQAELASWLTESLAHRVAYVRLNTAWESTQRLAALRQSEPIEIEPAGRFRSRLFKSAIAAIVVTVSGVAAALFLSQPTGKTYATALGERETVTLADGSQIELNTNTVLRISSHSDRRIVSLEKGEAYFEVRHNAARPFIVVAGDRRVTDLGTKFFVRRDVGRLEIAVVEGRVQLDMAAKQARATLLNPGDAAIATAYSTSVIKSPAKKLANELGWRRGVLVFDNTTLADAAAEFNRYNSDRLVLADAAAARLTIVGTFRTNDVATFADVVQDVLRLRVERRGGQTVISR